jgi:hypothetical protein
MLGYGTWVGSKSHIALLRNLEESKDCSSLHKDERLRRSTKPVSRGNPSAAMYKVIIEAAPVDCNGPEAVHVSIALKSEGPVLCRMNEGHEAILQHRCQETRGCPDLPEDAEVGLLGGQWRGEGRVGPWR